MLTTNPFFHRGPVREAAYFFGRAAEIKFIADLLRQGQSVAVNGQRRIGKTSLLFHLARATEPGVQWVYLDGGALDGLDEDWFYGAIDRALGGDADAVPYARFVERLRGLAAAQTRLVLALDEFELIARNPRFGPTLFNHLRGLAAQYPLQFITASKDPLLQLTFAHRDTLSSPFFNIFAPLTLGLFSQDESYQLLITLSQRSGQAFTTATAAFIFALVGPHPLFLQVAGYRAFALRHAPGDLTPEAQVTLREQVLADLDQHLTYYWNSLDPEAQYALAALPLLERGARPPALERLRAAGLLFETSETLEISEVLMGFVRRQKVDGLLQAGEFILDLRRGLVAARGQTIHLTPTEFAALRLFLERPGQMLTAEGIEAALWPGEVSPDTDRARGIVKKLRNALGPAGEALENRRGQGWWLNSGIGD